MKIRAKYGVDIGLIYQHLIEYRFERLKDMFREHILGSIESNKTIIRKIKSKDEEYLEHLSEQLQILDENLNILCNLYVVAIYIPIETELNNLAKRIDRSIEGNHRFNEINKNYKSFGVDIKNIKHYATIDTIRCINNCIKHSDGIVTKALQTASSGKYTEKSKLYVNDADLLKYIEDTKMFFAKLIEELRKNGKF